LKADTDVMQLGIASIEHLLPALLKDPPPSYAFELSEAGIEFATVGSAPQFKFEPLDPGVISTSPVRENILQPDLLQARIQALAPANGHRKRRAALILPDYCARVTVLDFDAFPASHDEQLALVRFRMKKSVPFDVDSAIVSYHAQPSGAGKIEVVVAVMACEIIARYEAPFRQLGIQPGFITTSALAALNLLKPDKVTVMVKLSGRGLTVLVLDGSVVKLARCVEMEGTRFDEIESTLHPTFAYIEDELETKATRIVQCGLGAGERDFADRWQEEWNVSVEPLKSRYGAPGENNAGLLGYLESVRG
jgi:type IV pilus assembly protein PilM